MKYTTSFTVMPCHSNYMTMIFGGELLARMDIAAAECIRTFLNSKSSNLYTVTVAVDKVTFLVGAEIGDLIWLECEIVRFGIKSFVVKIQGFRDQKGNPNKEKICTGEFTFVTKAQPKDTRGVAHGFNYENHSQNLRV